VRQRAQEPAGPRLPELQTVVAAPRQQGAVRRKGE
jgi:hypothetical protein